ncbi:MAG: hypothetical protein WA130_02120 [Candidatus Methanoperedens sp.]
MEDVRKIGHLSQEVTSFNNGLSTFGGTVSAYPIAHPFTAAN